MAASAAGDASGDAALNPSARHAASSVRVKLGFLELEYRSEDGSVLR
jgi:hypothetical protein